MEISEAAQSGGETPRLAGGIDLGQALGQGRVWFDLTTSIQLAALGPVGITRVEARYAAELARRHPDRIGFCRYDPGRGRYRPVDAASAAAVLDLERRADPPRTRKRRGPLRQAARDLEQWFRHSRRRLLRGLSDAAARRAGGAPAHPFRRGDFLVLGGMTWDKHDLARLRALRDEAGVALVCLCYDMVPAKFPQFHAADSIANFDRFAEFMVRDAALVLCISEATRRDLAEFAAARGLALHHARVIALGHDLAPPTADRPMGLPPEVAAGDYVLYVSTIQVRKNHALLYRVWRRMAERGERMPHLVFAGAVGWLVEDLLRLIGEDPLLKGRIVMLNRATDAELSWLYRNALFTVYPSIYEGWGLPISESLAQGKACIASNSSAMPEAGQGLAIHLDPEDLAAWHREIRALVDDRPRLAALEAEIRRRYRRLDWAEAAERFAAELARFAAGRG